MDDAVAPDIPPRKSSISTSTPGQRGSGSRPSIPERFAGPAIPTQLSSKRAWQEAIPVSQSEAELLSERRSITKSINHQYKRLKQSTSFDHPFWLEMKKYESLKEARNNVEVALQFQKAASRRRIKTLDDFLETKEGKEFETRHLALQESQRIADAQAERLRVGNGTFGDLFVRLFLSAKIGLSVGNTGMGQRDSKKQRNFKTKMMKAYLPQHSPKNSFWDPVLHDWVDTKSCNAAHLYPWRQFHSMGAIFGDELTGEIFNAKNGLFLHHEIEWALEEGIIAIVPDVDMDPSMPSTDKELRCERLLSWQTGGPKDYKVVVIDWNHKETAEYRVLSSKEKINSFADLHERKLTFLTKNRPRARYLWWAFFSSVTVAGWRQKLRPEAENNAIQKEIRNATRYWGTPEPYTTPSILSKFAQTIGQEVYDLHGNAVPALGDESDAGSAIVALERANITGHQSGPDVEGNEDDDADDDEDDEGSNSD